MMLRRFRTCLTLLPALGLCFPAAGQDRPQTAAAAAEQDFKVINKTGFGVVSFNVSPAGEAEWGPNVLGRAILRNSEPADITFAADIEGCLWDLRATYDDDDVTEMQSVNLCEVATVTLNP